MMRTWAIRYLMVSTRASEGGLSLSLSPLSHAPFLPVAQVASSIMKSVM